MLTKTMGLILADHHRIHLSELSQPRALAAIPIGGRYRIIDFILSNMVNSGITRVGVIALTAYKSLMDHLGTGASWDLDRMQQGLYIMPPYINAAPAGETSDLTGLYQFFHSATQDLVVLCDANVVMNYQFGDMAKAFLDGQYDGLALFNRDGGTYGSPVTTLVMDRKGIVTDVLVDAPTPPATTTFLGTIVMRRETLASLISESIARGQNDFSLERLLKQHKTLTIKGFEHKGKSLWINSVASYFRSSMRLLDKTVRDELFNPAHPIYTKVKNEAPAVYETDSVVADALCSDGCHIRGEVRHSILFRGVVVGKHAKVENAVVFQDTEIGEGAQLSHVIIDKSCVVRSGVRLMGHPDYPVVIRKGAVV